MTALGLSNSLMGLLPYSTAKDAPLMPNAPQRNKGTSDSRTKRYPIHTLITSQSLPAITLTVRQNHGMAIVNDPVEHIEDIPADDRRQTHTSPILGEASDAESVSHERWVDAVQDAVCQAGENRDDDELARVRDLGPSHLGYAEHDRRDEEAPEPGYVELLDEEIGPNTTEKTASKAED